jgi:hypothetical protein
MSATDLTTTTEDIGWLKWQLQEARRRSDTARGPSAAQSAARKAKRLEAQLSALGAFGSR